VGAFFCRCRGGILPIDPAARFLVLAIFPLPCPGGIGTGDKLWMAPGYAHRWD
jgi:hypothetical protein